MAVSGRAPGVLPPLLTPQDSLSTIPDPRAPVTPPELSRSHTASPAHPELSNEVTALSNKLIHAINHQTNLDDTLNDTRQQLEAAQERVSQLERSQQEYKSMVDNRILVKWADVEEDTLRMRMSLADERKRRVQAENEKRAMDQELENLTQALFEEANQMVAAAKRDSQVEREIVERRNEQYQAQLKESESLLASHQEQLAELKLAMAELSIPRKDLDGLTITSTDPSTPAADINERFNGMFDNVVLSPTTPNGTEPPPAPPTQFSHLISPILRNDVPAFEDFQTLMDLGRRSGPSSRIPSGNYSGFAGLGLTGMVKPEHAQPSMRNSANGSTTSLPGSHAPPSASSTPNMIGSNHSSFSSRETPAVGIPLKETSFYKRALVEDIEPTLRLDLAPGLSWLARRSVINSICEGRLVIEPTPGSVRHFRQPCSLCGEQSRQDSKSRTHRFRINESETAQRYPLCEYCLNRTRSTCDYLSFLRLIKDGHWRTEGSEGESAAWEESVRLRERMFWARIGGGVIPTMSRSKQETPRTSTEDVKGLPPLPVSADHGTETQPSHQSEMPLVDGTTLSNDNLQVVSPADSPFAEVGSSRKRSPGQSIGSEHQQPESTSLSSTERQLDNSTRQDSETAPSAVSLRRISMKTPGAGRPDSAGSGQHSIAKRAAMFERQNSQHGVSNQLQESLQASLQNRSPTIKY